LVVFSDEFDPPSASQAFASPLAGSCAPFCSAEPPASLLFKANAIIKPFG